VADPLDHPLERDGDGGARQPQARRLGGHIASFASAATLYDVGFNHFWRAPSADHPGDLLYIQGHSSPGIYARAFLEGRISEEQLDHFRMEVDGKGISSYPHPWLMPDFWQTPTCRWAWARSARSTRRASGSTSKAAA
jgi:pyruvate dehydrogenase complex dehydrogenase (E1) component